MLSFASVVSYHIYAKLTRFPFVYYRFITLLPGAESGHSTLELICISISIGCLLG